jgi:pimeloyl-ACP methyl ester carboxylesterase
MMHYEAIGTGHPIVLVHGFGEDYHVFDKQVEALKEKYKLIVPHLPGTGRSAISDTVSMESMADGIKEILERENISRTIIIGHSMGGYITLAFAEKYPDMLKGFGLLHSSAYADSELKIAARRKSIEFIKQYGAPTFLESTTPNLFAEANRIQMGDYIKSFSSAISYILPNVLITFYEAMINRPDRTNILKRASVPVLFIVGKEDQTVPFTDTMQQVHLPVLSYIYILYQSGHMGMLEEPGKCNEAIHHFLDVCN